MPQPTRDEVAASLWQVAEQNIIAEWICCDPIDPTHQLCVKGDATLKMTKALLVDSSDAWKSAPLLDAVMEQLAAASLPLPSINAHDVQGFCPACGHGVLMLGEGGHVVCTLIDCPNPDSVDQLLRGVKEARRG